MGDDGGVSLRPADTDVPLTERPPTRRAGVMAATGLIAALAIATLTVAPAPFAIAQAGPTFDTLGMHGDEPVVDIYGMPTYDSSGELRLTTVSFSRAGSRPFTVGRVLAGYLSSDETVSPQEFIFGTSQQQEQQAEHNQQEWVTSQESATVAALNALGIEVPATVTVAEVSPWSTAADLLRSGDVLTSIDGAPLVTYTDLSDALDGRHPGDPITVGIARAGVASEVSFTLVDDPDNPGPGRMGIFVVPTFDLPIVVNVAIDEVSGPSGGLMFALAIMDKLTAADEAGGAHIAGTGVIDIDGQVSPIGGIDHKMRGARDAGATSFLAPLENCPEVVGHVPHGLNVYAVDTLADAYAAMVAIGKHNTADLPTCASVAAKE